MSLDIELYMMVDTGGEKPRYWVIYEDNITHNLNKMASEAGIYKAIWRPGEVGIKKAGDLIEPLRNGIDTLKESPEKFKAFNPKNGWGNYNVLLESCERYLEVCVQNPEALISVRR